MKYLLLTACTALLFLSCKKGEDEGVNLFSIQKDIELGAQVASQIESDSSGYVILDTVQYAEAYAHINRIVDTILGGGEVFYEDQFVWRTRIIHDDSTLNAFCAPGGYMYVFTGLIHYLDSEDQLAGVMGHEIAHADKRHSTEQLTKQYGIQLLLQAALGEESAIADVTAGLLLLKYSRTNESEADVYSVRYLCPTQYNAAGGAGFFEKIEAAGGSSVPEFLSTHPSPDKRIETFYDTQDEYGCTGTATYDSLYQAFKNSLP